MSTYGQFCPVAKAMEVLDERWTMLIVRELLLEVAAFGDLQRGVPKMSPTLLSTRLRRLERVGVVRRHVVGGRSTVRADRGAGAAARHRRPGHVGSPMGRRPR